MKDHSNPNRSKFEIDVPNNTMQNTAVDFCRMGIQFSMIMNF